MIRLDAATVLLQWATGGMLFCWFTTRRRMVGLGYGWLLRSVYGLMAAGAFAVGLRFGAVPAREIAALAVVATCAVGIVVSVRHKSSTSSGLDEYPPILDLIPAVIGAVGLIAAAVDAGGNTTVAILRTLVGAAFLGVITDAMLLGHWYLVQPGLPRRLLNEIVAAIGVLWPFEVLVMLLPTGMLAVLSGEVDDGWGGLLGWMWVGCALTTVVLVLVTRAALKERYYSAVMAATGLLYLSILTGFGMDILPRAILSDA